MGVRGLLVSAPEEQLQAFHMGVFMSLNCIDRRGQTVRYACFDENFEAALRVARDCDCTVQEIIDAGDTESYELRAQGSHGMLWAPANR